MIILLQIKARFHILKCLVVLLSLSDDIVLMFLVNDVMKAKLSFCILLRWNSGSIFGRKESTSGVGSKDLLLLWCMH